MDVALIQEPRRWNLDIACYANHIEAIYDYMELV